MNNPPASKQFAESFESRERRKEVRQWFRRKLAVPFFFVLLLLKWCRVPNWCYFGRLRQFMESWDAAMLRMYVFSFGNRMYMDQPCTLRDPPNFKPRIETSDDLELSEEQIRSFYANGFLGPLTLCSREEMVELREQVMRELERPSEAYGGNSGRDRHLDCPALWKMLNRPALTERMAQILGPNLLMWRSQVLLKAPGDREVTWHQATTYVGEEVTRVALIPPDPNELFEITTWLAFDDVDYANGCMQFVRGSHRKVNTIRIGGQGVGGFGRANFKLEYEVDPEKVATMELTAGQFVFFLERTIHGSPPNNSNRRRWGMAFRTCVPEVRVYPNRLTHKVAYLDAEYDLTQWGVVVLRGTDTAHLNRIKNPPEPVLPA